MFELLINYGPKLLDGAVMTLQLTFISVSIAGLLSLPLAILRRSKNILWQWPIRLYVSFFRGTPLLAQLFLVYYGSGQFRPELTELGLWWFFRDPYYCALLTFALNSTAYQLEILRGGLQAVPYGEVEAGVALGMPRRLLYQKIILPHTYRIAFPALGNEIILMLKGGAIASVITLLDVMGHTRRVFSQTFDISVYLWAALIYLVITTVFVLVWRLLERRLTRHMFYQRDIKRITPVEATSTKMEASNVN
ncbi:ABC transporter permease [Amphritea balenae]|uniref:Arginine ABC transporter permease protein ArtM n=1 Tax=Amphritea balenae TaxID=452629 RepID=A0A3P1SX54_9GAMM|nr:ABC transporter permease [Amphritea balenae]RRD01565.1 ABC transporter permease [Amphritea balenae]GGK55855.1 amino acid ABC transporter permease [Amphritea balenae]